MIDQHIQFLEDKFKNAASILFEKHKGPYKIEREVWEDLAKACAGHKFRDCELGKINAPGLISYDELCDKVKMRETELLKTKSFFAENQMLLDSVSGSPTVSEKLIEAAGKLQEVSGDPVKKNKGVGKYYEEAIKAIYSESKGEMQEFVSEFTGCLGDVLPSVGKNIHKLYGGGSQKEEWKEESFRKQHGRSVVAFLLVKYSKEIKEGNLTACVAEMGDNITLEKVLQESGFKSQFGLRKKGYRHKLLKIVRENSELKAEAELCIGRAPCDEGPEFAPDDILGDDKLRDAVANNLVKEEAELCIGRAPNDDRCAITLSHAQAGLFGATSKLEVESPRSSVEQTNPMHMV